MKKNEQNGLLPKEPKVKTPNATSPDLEQYLGCGFYQFYHLILCQFVLVAQANNMTFMVFGKIVPKLECLDNTTTITVENWTQFANNQCEKYVVCKNVTVNSIYRSLVQEFVLICDDRLIFICITMQMVGVILGAQIAGQLSDWYGRKWVLLISLTVQICFALCSTLSPNMTVYTVLRFFIGFSAGGTISTNHVYLNEFVQSRHRLWLGALNNPGLVMMFMAGVAWLTLDWKWTTIVCNLVAVPGVFMIYFNSESSSWLLARGEISKAKETIDRVNRMNGRKVDQNFAREFQDFQIGQKKKRHSFWHIFEDKSMARNMAILSFTYFSISLVSYGLMFNANNLAGNVFLVFFIFGALKYAACLITVLFDVCYKSVGRKTIIAFGSTVISLCCLVMLILDATGMSKSLYQTLLAVTVVTVLSPMYTSMNLSTNELHPTSVRSIAQSIVSTFSRTGSAVAPQLLYFATKFWSPVMYAIFCVVTLTYLVLYLFFIPETRGRPLPYSMPPSRKSSSGKKLSPTTVDQCMKV